MATAELVAPFPKLRFVDSNGNALSGGKLFTYTGGTTTKTSTFTDSTGATPNANPILLDTRGECNCWIPANTNIKFVLSPSTDTDPPTNAIWTVDNVSSNLPATSIIPCTATGTNIIVLTPVSGTVTSYTDQQLFSFYAAATSSGLVTLNVSSVGAKNAYLPGGTQQAGADSFISGQFYVVAFNAALNSNAGGFVKVGQDATSGAFATLASAATTNIGAANAGYVQITGTTTIIAFDTALSGIERTLEFAGALTLTHNATSLILPGSKNIVTVAGDTATFRSEGSGNWRCISYQPASAALLRDVVGAVRNLKVVQASATTATVTADEIICKTALGGIPRIISSLNVTLNIATTGANGMDTGSATLNADLSLYAIAGPGKTDAVLAVLGATSNGNIYSGVNMPAGYTASALIGSYLMNGSAQFNAFVQIDRLVSIAAIQVLNAGTAVSLTAVSLATTVPANTRYVEGYSQTSTTNAATIAADANSLGAKVNQNVGNANTGMYDMNLHTTQQIFYSVSAGNVSIWVSVYGF